MARVDDMIHLAYKISAETMPDCSFRVGAVVARGKRIISSATCSTKTHPKNPKIVRASARDNICAEVLAVLKALSILKTDTLASCIVYIARSRRDGSIAIAKPCPICQDFLRDHKIKRAYYTTNSGKIEVMETR